MRPFVLKCANFGAPDLDFSCATHHGEGWIWDVCKAADKYQAHVLVAKLKPLITNEMKGVSSFLVPWVDYSLTTERFPRNASAIKRHVVAVS